MSEEKKKDELEQRKLPGAPDFDEWIASAHWDDMTRPETLEEKQRREQEERLRQAEAAQGDWIANLSRSIAMAITPDYKPPEEALPAEKPENDEPETQPGSTVVPLNRPQWGKNGFSQAELPQQEPAEEEPKHEETPAPAQTAQGTDDADLPEEEDDNTSFLRQSSTTKEGYQIFTLDLDSFRARRERARRSVEMDEEEDVLEGMLEQNANASQQHRSDFSFVKPAAEAEREETAEPEHTEPVHTEAAEPDASEKRREPEETESKPTEKALPAPQAESSEDPEDEEELTEDEETSDESQPEPPKRGMSLFQRIAAWVMAPRREQEETDLQSAEEESPAPQEKPSAYPDEEESPTPQEEPSRYPDDEENLTEETEDEEVPDESMLEPPKREMSLLQRIAAWAKAPRQEREDSDEELPDEDFEPGENDEAEAPAPEEAPAEEITAETVSVEEPAAEEHTEEVTEEKAEETPAKPPKRKHRRKKHKSRTENVPQDADYVEEEPKPETIEEPEQEEAKLPRQDEKPEEESKKAEPEKKSRPSKQYKKKKHSDRKVTLRKPDNVVAMPVEKPNLIQRKLEEVEERANEFADSMFSGDNEEVQEEEKVYRKAERYIPGTDEEQKPAPKKKPKAARKPPKPVERKAPDLSPKELGRIYHSSWKSGGSRLPAQMIIAVVLLLITSAAGGVSKVLVIPALAENTRLTGILLLLGLVGACGVGLDTLLEGIVLLFRKKPSLSTLSSIGALLTLIDALWYVLLGREGPLPFCGFAALSLWSVAWGNHRKKEGLYRACQSAASASHPQRLTMDEGKWDNKGTFIKEEGTAKGFGSQIQAMDGAQRVYRYAAPVMIVACLVFGIFSAVGQKKPQQLIWSWSVIFVLATPLASTLAFGQPYSRLNRRLCRSGIVLAGWDGVSSMKGDAGIAITDTDLFPDGFVSFNAVKNFGSVSLEKLTGCTASMLREADVGLKKICDDQVRMQGGFYRRVDDLKYSEAGGFSGLIRGDRVLVGSAAYLKVMGIYLEPGYQAKNAVYCVINGTLQGFFALNYQLPDFVKPSLEALIRGGVNPIMATRDFNITPQMLRQRFSLPSDRMVYPPVEKRHALSAEGQAHNEVLGALITREGLGTYTDAILGGRRLLTVVKLNTIIAVLASVVGALLGFYLTLMSAYQSLSPWNILFFLLMWLLPNLLISAGADKF